MKIEQIHRAIAESLGTQFIPVSEWDEDTINNTSAVMIRTDGTIWPKIPDYTSDLNAMHDVIKSSGEDYSTGWLDQILWESYEPKHLVSSLDRLKATAAQLSEWHLKTIGKWVD